MDMDIEMGDAIEGTTDVQVEELPPADEIIVRNPFYFFSTAYN